MKLIKRITNSDVQGGDPELLNTISRYGCRGVLFDNKLNVAMMHMTKVDLYKLPGGGMEKGESVEDTFLREIKEETGYEAEIIKELGYIEEHKTRNDFMQFSYCFLARACNKVSTENLSDSEKYLGMEVKWLTLNNALEAMNYSLRNSDEYSSKFMIIRDKTILEKAASILNEPTEYEKN